MSGLEMSFNRKRYYLVLPQVQDKYWMTVIWLCKFDKYFILSIKGKIEAHVSVISMLKKLKSQVVAKVNLCLQPAPHIQLTFNTYVLNKHYIISTKDQTSFSILNKIYPCNLSVCIFMPVNVMYFLLNYFLVCLWVSFLETWKEESFIQMFY